MEAKRLYKGKDADMVSKVSGMLAEFEIHLADFTAFDPGLNAAYAAQWKAAKTEAIVDRFIEGDERETKLDELLIEDSTKTLRQCHAKYKDVKYFASVAFPGNKEVLKEFGEGQYSKVCNSRLDMVQFMETLYGVTTKYKTALLASNYTQAAIDEIAAIATELRSDNKVQQLKRKERPTETRKRIEALNRFYGFGQRVADAAREVYRNNAVLRDAFRLAQRHHPKTTKSWVTLGANSKRKTALGKLLKKYNVTLTNQGKATVEFWQADSVHQSPLRKFLLDAGESIELAAETGARKFLIVHNSSSEKIRMMLTKEAKE